LARNAVEPLVDVRGLPPKVMVPWKGPVTTMFAEESTATAVPLAPVLGWVSPKPAL